MASTPMACRVMTTGSRELPVTVWPLSSTAIVTNTGRSVVRAASTAARMSAREVCDSMAMKSTPALSKARICWRYKS